MSGVTQGRKGKGQVGAELRLDRALPDKVGEPETRGAAACVKVVVVVVVVVRVRVRVRVWVWVRVRVGVGVSTHRDVRRPGVTQGRKGKGQVGGG